jgi:hypothetical protein
MLDQEQRNELIRIVNDLNALHESLPDPVLIPEELMQLFEFMPELCQAMAAYTLACHGHGTLSPVE